MSRLNDSGSRESRLAEGAHARGRPGTHTTPKRTPRLCAAHAPPASHPHAGCALRARNLRSADATLAPCGRVTSPQGRPHPCAAHAARDLRRGLPCALRARDTRRRCATPMRRSRGAHAMRAWFFGCIGGASVRFCVVRAMVPVRPACGVLRIAVCPWGRAGHGSSHICRMPAAR